MQTRSPSSTGRIADMIEDRDADRRFRVQRHVFVDDNILAAEREAIFRSGWLYVGHASEVPTAGCYVTRSVAGREMLMVRSDAGAVEVFFNACAHRGNVVAKERSGKTRSFVCFYHAWSYGLDGALARVPMNDAYPADFATESLGLRRPARTADYRGLIFISHDPEEKGLEPYLGNAKQYVDYMLDASDGESEIVKGTQRYSMRANWKLLVENSIDSYHALVVHQRYFSQYMQMSASDLQQAAAGRDHRGLQLDNGHAVVEAPALAMPIGKQADELKRLRARLTARHGAAQASRILDYTRMLFLFPNTIMISSWKTVRTFYPRSPDYMEVESWALMPVGEDEQLRDARLDNFISFLGPAGFGTPDDVEALEGCQRGFEADPQAWSDVSRGMNRDHPVKTDEIQMRSFWREWRARMARIEAARTGVKVALPDRGVR